MLWEEPIPAKHHPVSSYPKRVHPCEMHTHFSASFPSRSSEPSLHSYLLLMPPAGEKILPQTLQWQCIYYFCTELYQSYQHGSPTEFGFISSVTWTAAELDVGIGKVLRKSWLILYSSKGNFQQNSKAWHSITEFYFFFFFLFFFALNQLFNNFLFFKQSSAITF